MQKGRERISVAAFLLCADRRQISMQVTRANLRIAAKHLPVSMTANERNLFDSIALLEEARYAFVTKVVKSQVMNLQLGARAREDRRKARRLVREDMRPLARLATHNIERLAEQRNNLVVPDFLFRMLPIANDNRSIFPIKIIPQ